MTRQPRGEERRRRILRAALAVIGSGGIGAVTHRSVAEVAEVPLGSLTYYFRSKEDLLREALLLFVEEETARLRALGESLETERLSPEAIAERFAEALVGTDPDQVAQFELYLEASRNRPCASRRPRASRPMRRSASSLCGPRVSPTGSASRPSSSGWRTG
ncbi:MAG: TetR family transcriptional regulator [Solirubrobacterales bacterium]|nr:TetR family transcriptional regulator [Solirubrobacterales bacterium]